MIKFCQDGPEEQKLIEIIETELNSMLMIDLLFLKELT